MTAIAGIWQFDGQGDVHARCVRMLAGQAIYGRDGANVWGEGEIALGRRLTRLVPEDAYDRQPDHGAESGLSLVADLRIDNRDELLDELGVHNSEHPFLSDSAVFLQAWERWEEEALQRIVG